MTNIPYDIHPGPPLSPKGEKEAEALAEFLKAAGCCEAVLQSICAERQNCPDHPGTQRDPLRGGNKTG